MLPRSRSPKSHPNWDALLSIGLASGGGSSGSLSCRLGYDVGLVYCALHDLLFFRVEVFGKVLVQYRLLLLKSYQALANTAVWSQRPEWHRRESTHTKQRMLEHAIRFDLIKRRLQETLLFQLIVIIICHGRELLRFLVEEFKVSGAFVLDIFFIFGFSSPLVLITPFFFVFFIIVGRVLEVIFFLGIFTV
jgi:hypothetical protein